MDLIISTIGKGLATVPNIAELNESQEEKGLLGGTPPTVRSLLVMRLDKGDQLRIEQSFTP